jgi:hypothetical protein
MGNKKHIEIHHLPSLLNKREKSILGQTMSKKKAISRADLYRQEGMSPQKALALLRSASFEDYILKSNQGNSNPLTPIHIFFGLKQVAERKTSISRLLTIRELKIICGVSASKLNRHLFRFINANLVEEHAQGIRSSTKKTYTYTVTPIEDWDKDLILFMENQLAILMERNKGLQ